MLTAFNAKIILNTAVTSDYITWTVGFTLSDGAGVYGTSDVTEGNYLIIDTSPVAPATLTRYVITAVNSRTPSEVEAVIQLDDPSMEEILPDLEWCVGFDHIIFAPTVNHQYAMLPDFQIQGVPSFFDTYTRNADFAEKVDLLSPGSSNVTTYTYIASSPSDTWSINHNGNSINYICQVFDSTGHVIFPDDIETIDNNNVTITFGAAQAGRAQLLIFNA